MKALLVLFIKITMAALAFMAWRKDRNVLKLRLHNMDEEQLKQLQGILLFYGMKPEMLTPEQRAKQPDFGRAREDLMDSLRKLNHYIYGKKETVNQLSALRSRLKAVMNTFL